jgi:hypothetical protein
MTREEAENLLNLRLHWFEKKEPCLATAYKSYILGHLDLRQFTEQATNDILAAYSALGKLL